MKSSNFDIEEKSALAQQAYEDLGLILVEQYHLGSAENNNGCGEDGWRPILSALEDHIFSKVAQK